MFAPSKANANGPEGIRTSHLRPRRDLWPGSFYSEGSRPAPRRDYRSPWQNGVAERWVGNVRKELLDHAVVFNERHLRRLLTDYVAYYHADRTHYALRNRLREAACRLLRSDSAMRSSPANGSVWKCGRTVARSATADHVHPPSRQGMNGAPARAPRDCPPAFLRDCLHRDSPIYRGQPISKLRA
jgi:hypothetical protein